MNVSEITLYNVLKVKLGESEAQTVVEGIKEEVKNQLADKTDVLATKLDLEKIRSELLVVKWMLGVVLAGIVSLVVKSFFS